MKNKYLFIFPLIAVTVAGCDFFGTTIIYPSSQFVPTHLDPVSPYQEDKGEGYEKINLFSYNLQDVKKHSPSSPVPLPSLDDSYLLVVPVSFKDAPSWTSKKLEMLDKAFFGESDDTAWESVSSFYHKSSYEKLTLHGEIAPTLEINKTKQVAGAGKNPDEVAIKTFNEKSEYDSLRSKYDKNADGFIDSVAFIYSNSVDSSEEDYGYWAWTSWWRESPNTEKPVVKSYLWMSYDFFTNEDREVDGSRKYAGYGNEIDCHTAIHETGHLLGLDDYYLYEQEQGEVDPNYKYDPSGALEMQSYNIGDQNIYSKFALGWVNPYYVKTESSVTLRLRTSAQYGDAILLNDEWNNNSMDEYIIIEYYSPFGLNQIDAERKYGPNGEIANQMYTDSGFRIYHVDSRICTLTNAGSVHMPDYVFSEYVDDLSSKEPISVAASNTPVRSRYTKTDSRQKSFKYLHLLENGGKNTFKSGKKATNSTLFKENSQFFASSEFFVNGSKFNNGSEIGYKISIGECDGTSGTVTITKI